MSGRQFDRTEKPSYEPRSIRLNWESESFTSRSVGDGTAGKRPLWQLETFPSTVSGNITGGSGEPLAQVT
jgi:hypothetical protein